MKKYLLIALTVLSILTTYSFTLINGKVDDVFRTLGLPESDAKVHIWKSFAGKYFSVPSNSLIKKYPANKRAVAADDDGDEVD